VRVEGDGTTLVFRTSAAQALGVSGGRAGLLDLSAPLTGLDEPWLVFFGHAGAEHAPVLLTFSRSIVSLSRQADGYEIHLAAPGAVHAMPLEGGGRRRPIA
jgi:hypothetical protein